MSHSISHTATNPRGLARIWIITILAGLALIILLGARPAANHFLGTTLSTERIVPRVQIIQFDDSVARFDTRTGEIHRFNGDLNRPQVRGQWVSVVNGVDSSTSGVLEIQRAEGVRAESAVFLVDVIEGDTWLLRHRGSGADWDRIEIFRR